MRWKKIIIILQCLKIIIILLLFFLTYSTHGCWKKLLESIAYAELFYHIDTWNK